MAALLTSPLCDCALRLRRRDHVQVCMQVRLRGHRVETTWLALSIRSCRSLLKIKNPAALAVKRARRKRTGNAYPTQSTRQFKQHATRHYP